MSESLVHEGVHYKVLKDSEGRYRVRDKNNNEQVYVAKSKHDVDARSEAIDKAGSLDTLRLNK